VLDFVFHTDLFERPLIGTRYWFVIKRDAGAPAVSEARVSKGDFPMDVAYKWIRRPGYSLATLRLHS
jgi:hypothetical protein